MQLKSILLATSTLFASALASAQTEDFASDDVIQRRSTEEPLNEGDYPATVQTLGDGAQGNPYFTNDWSEGQVTLDGGEEYDNVSLRYDVYRNRLLVRGQDGKAMPLRPEDVRSFVVGPNRIANLARFTRARYVAGFDEVPDDQFVQVLYEAESRLLAVHRKPTRPSDEAGGAGAPDQLEATVTQYYYMSPEGEVSRFEPNRESALKLFSDQREAVESFIRDTMLDFDSVVDLRRLVGFYDQQN
jgi:hypothetical protein